jgi:regulatory protein
VFDDETEPRLTSAATLKQLPLQNGMALDPEELDAQLLTIEVPLAKDRVLRLLGYREHTRKELQTKLHKGGYPASVVKQVLDRFSEIDLVDDNRFAHAWVRTRAAAGFGRIRIARELVDKGVDPDVAGAALVEELEGSDEVVRARAILRGKLPSDRRERERLIRRLITRGFSFHVALSALDADDDSDLTDET